MGNRVLRVLALVILVVSGGYVFFAMRATHTFTSPGKSDSINVTSPLPGTTIDSPFTITGSVRGTWFFEASFPVVLTDGDGKIIAQGNATAQSDWMTTDFVPFSVTLSFEKPSYRNNGFLILKKDNPSGLPQYDDAIEVPIHFK